MNALFILDLIGTAVFAYTGSVAAKQQRFHALGVFYISFLTAVGGGTLRSILLQSPDLFWMSSSAYLIVVTTVVSASYVVRINTNRLWFYLLDSQSLAIFVALGFIVTLAHGQPLHIAFAMGVLSGIGGGLIRDAITSQPPQALSDPAYPVMMLAAAIGCLSAQKLGLQPWTLSCLAVLLVVSVTAAINYFRSGTPVKYNRTRQPIKRDVRHSSEDVRLEYHSLRRRSDGSRERHASNTQLSRKAPAPGIFRSADSRSNTGLMATIHASSIVVLSCIAGLYYFNQSITDATANIALSPANRMNSTHPAGTPPAIPTSAQANEKHKYQSAIHRIEELLASRQLSEAETLITRTKKNLYAGPDLMALEASTGNLKAYLRRLNEAELALAAHDIPALKEMLSTASGFGFTDHRLDTLRLNLANALQRETIEAANTRLNQKSFKLHLVSAEHYFGLGNLDLAVAEIEMARSFNIGDHKLDKLSQQIESERQFQATPLSDADFAFAVEKFKQLETAIKLKNTQAISALTANSPKRNELFNSLFDRYVELTTNVSDFSHGEDNKIVSSTLALEKMRLPNGNIAYPATSYGEIKLSIERTPHGWSKIRW